MPERRLTASATARGLTHGAEEAALSTKPTSYFHLGHLADAVGDPDGRENVLCEEANAGPSLEA